MIDLHIHTQFSDGKDSVEEVLKQAQNLALTAISITDHDNIEAYDVLSKPDIRALYTGKIIPGVEISSLFNGTVVHILGYGVDIEKLKGRMKTIDGKMWADFARNYLNGKLKKLGLATELKGQTWVGVLRELIEIIETSGNPVLKSIDLTSVLGKSKIGMLVWYHIYDKESPLYIDYTGFYVSSDEAIKIIHDCGGIAVLAHPIGYGKYSDMVLNGLCGKVDGIECYHYTAESSGDIDRLISICKEKGLLVTGGTDYHGAQYPFGYMQVPDTVLERLIASGVRTI